MRHLLKALRGPVPSIGLLMFVPWTAGNLWSQECPGGRTPLPGLGIGVFHCQGGWCKVGGAIANAGRQELEQIRAQSAGRYWDFSVEPTLWSIDDGGPSAGKIEDGDALVAVNGRSIASVSGTEELGRMRPGEPLDLTIRRNGELLEVRVVPAVTCERVAVSAGGDRPTTAGLRALLLRSRAELDDRRPSVSVVRIDVPAGNALGVTLSCSSCRTPLIGSEWRFVEDPVVIAVATEGPAARAGLTRGDILTHADGLPLTSPEGAERLRSAADVDSLRLRFTRGGTPRSVTVMIDSPPEGRNR